MSTPVSLKLVVDRDSLNADLTGMFGGLSRIMDDTVRKMDSSIQYAVQRWTSQFQELGHQIGLALNIENVVARLNSQLGTVRATAASAVTGGGGAGNFNPDLRERAFGWAMRFAEQGWQGRGVGEMSDVSAMIQQREVERYRSQVMASQLAQRAAFDAEARSYVGRAFGHAAGFADQARMGTGASEMDVLSGAINSRYMDRASIQAMAQQSAQRAAFDAEAKSYVQRAFGHAAGFADMERQGRGAGDMDILSGAIQQRASDHTSAAAAANQAALYNQLMAQAAQDRLGITLRGTRTDSSVAYEAMHRDEVLRQQDVLYGNLRSGAFVTDGGYRRTSTSIGPNGEPVSESYNRRAGLFTNAETLSRNLKTGEMNRQIQETTSLAHKMWTAIAGEGGPVSQGLNASLAPLRAIHSVAGKIVGVFHSIGNEAIRLSALFYSFRRIGEGLEHAFVSPIEYVMNATTKGREFESSIAGLAGVGGARNIDRGLIASMNNTPFGLDETRQQFMEFSKIAPFSRAIAAGGGMQQFSQFQQILAGLQVLNPGSDVSTVTQGVTGAFLGQGRSLRGVVRIDPDQLAELVGERGQKAFRDRPELLMQALQRYIQAFAAPGSIQARQNLPGVQLGHIQGTFENAVSQIGDSGIFDAVVKELKKVSDAMFQYVQSPEFQARAEAISGFLTTILHNVGDAIMSFASGFTGQEGVKKNADGVAKGVEGVVQALADASYQLPSAAMLAGQALKALVSNIADFADFLIRMTDKFTSSHPMGDLDRSKVLSRRLDELGFGPSQQSMQKINGGDYIPGMVGEGHPTMQRMHDSKQSNFYYTIGAIGPNKDLIYKIVNRANGTLNDNGSRTGGISDTALKDQTFFDYLMRDLVPLPMGFPGAPRPTTQPATGKDILSKGILDEADVLDQARKAFGDAKDAKDPQLQALMYQLAMPQLMNLSRDEQSAMLDQATKSRLGALSEMGKGAPQYDSMLGMIAGRRSVGGDKVQVLQQALANSQAIALDRQVNSELNPGDAKAAAEYQAAANNVAVFTAQLQRAQQESSLLETSMVQFGNQAQRVFEDGLGKALTDIETRTGNVRAAFAAMAKDILSQFNSMAMHNIFGAIFGTPNGQSGAGNGWGGLLGQGINAVGNGLSNLFASVMYPTVQPFAGVTATVDPAVMSEVSSAVAGFAYGGVASRPTLGVFGEAGPEAFVPMQDGHIPLMIHSDGGVSASLPHGRTIPARFMADGGVLGGSNVATMGAAPGWSSSAASGRGAGGGASGESTHVTNVMLDSKVIASHSYKLSRPLMQGEIVRAMGPGGNGRRAASRA